MSKPITMTRSAFVREHTHLIKILREPTLAKLKAEARKQAKELKEKR